MSYADAQKRVDELRRRFASYDGGDRPMSPPVALIRELQEAETELQGLREGVAMEPQPQSMAQKFNEWQRLRDGVKRLSDRDMSDEARRWADEEADVSPMPVNAGEWKASLEIAFEAGRMLERGRR